MKQHIKKKKEYTPPKIDVALIELEHSIAASSVTTSPGGGANNSTPWVTEEDVETKQQDWNF